MIGQILLGFSHGFRLRKKLLQIMTETKPGTTIFTIDLARLHQNGIKILALDFDGVLSPHGANEPEKRAVEWLQNAAIIFGEENIFILSNKPTDARNTWFREHFTKIRFISGVRKKPYPDGINKISEIAAVPAASILMVDDRLLTGCLAALNGGAIPCWINRPTKSFATRPFAEFIFMLLRLIERCFVKITAKLL